MTDSEPEVEYPEQDQFDGFGRPSYPKSVRQDKNAEPDDAGVEHLHDDAAAVELLSEAERLAGEQS